MFISRFYNGLWVCQNIVDVLNQFNFTGNAIAMDLRSKEFYDPMNGWTHLDSRHSNDTDLHFIIYDYISGQTLDQFVKASGSTSEQRNLFSEIIQTIEQIAQLNIYGYGDLENEREAKHTTYRFFLEYTFEEGIRAAHNSNLLDPSQISKIEKISKKIHDFDVGNTGVLAWADVTPSNIIVNSCGRLAALIDFESVLSSVVDLNLGYCYSRSRNSSFYKRFKEIWEAELGKVDPEIIYFYGLLRLLRILPFSSGHLPINQNAKSWKTSFRAHLLQSN